MESVLEDGSKVMRFANGNRKMLGKDGKTESVYFFNGDVKHTKPDKTVVCVYCKWFMSTHVVMVVVY